MKRVSIQMVDNTVSSEWWKTIIHHFLRVGDNFELRCWEEETPTDKEIYNKMTKYFTINVKNELCNICSEHYGTEMYIVIYSDVDVLFFEQVMKQYSDDCFSIGEW